MKWQLIPIDQLPDIKSQIKAHRLNSLGSLYYFCKVVLRFHRLTNHLHKEICDGLEKSYIKDIYEIPRDHFKSTICSVGLPMWWSLPFTTDDEDLMYKLGYDAEWMIWMRRAHDQDSRTLIVSEVITNAVKLGSKISQQYENNDFFRGLFPEIIPDSSCVWNANTMTHKRLKGGTPQGEGTYDVIGVGGALQSRHYKRVVQDDLVGRAAANSDVVMADTINYHQLLVGAFDSDPLNPGQSCDELIVGNRWSYRDLNSWVRENEPYFNIVNHSALGGCCAKHPSGQPIFPEEFTVGKLNEFHKRLGVYEYSCQYLNQPVPPGDSHFKKEWLRYYSYSFLSPSDKRATILHEVQEGEVIKDGMPGNLSISLVCDPNHAGNSGRCRHAITVTGVQQSPLRVYLLDVWAESCGYEELISKLYQLAEKFKLRKIWLETVAAQKYLKFHLDYRNKIEKRSLEVKDLKSPNSPNAKAQRIEALEPLFSNKQFWVQRYGQEDFLVEYLSYPYGKTKDIMDTLGYAPQTWVIQASNSEIASFVANNKARLGNRNSVTGY
jgi:hypothetical protein